MPGSLGEPLSRVGRCAADRPMDMAGQGVVSTALVQKQSGPMPSRRLWRIAIKKMMPRSCGPQMTHCTSAVRRSALFPLRYSCFFGSYLTIAVQRGWKKCNRKNTNNAKNMALQPVRNPLDLQAWSGEVQQQSKAQAGCLEVVYALRLVHIVQRLHGLQF